MSDSAVPVVVAGALSGQRVLEFDFDTRRELESFCELRCHLVNDQRPYVCLMRGDDRVCCELLCGLRGHSVTATSLYLPLDPLLALSWHIQNSLALSFVGTFHGQEDQFPSVRAIFDALELGDPVGLIWAHRQLSRPEAYRLAPTLHLYVGFWVLHNKSPDFVVHSTFEDAFSAHVEVLGLSRDSSDYAMNRALEAFYHWADDSTKPFGAHRLTYWFDVFREFSRDEALSFKSRFRELSVLWSIGAA